MSLRVHWWKFFVAIVVIEMVGGGIGILTAGQIDGWYQSLVEPRGTPPNWVFGPVWSLLYAMIAASGVVFWLRSDGTTFRKSGLAWFAIQLVLNFVWTPVFFGMHQLGTALVVIVALNLSIWITISLFTRASRLAGWLLIPYAIWVSYATYLNAGFWWLNR